MVTSLLFTLFSFGLMGKAKSTLVDLGVVKGIVGISLTGLNTMKSKKKKASRMRQLMAFDRKHRAIHQKKDRKHRAGSIPSHWYLTPFFCHAKGWGRCQSQWLLIKKAGPLGSLWMKLSDSKSNNVWTNCPSKLVTRLWLFGNRLWDIRAHV